ncbi:Quinolinate synthase A [uncultured archaeon]|nr:Quinolinate synthase A [uncultured archaeon]
MGVNITVDEDVAALSKEIKELRKRRDAVILAHNYQRPEVMDVADYIGDSLGLSRQAAATDAKVIVFCGVDFMAETASILNPGKTVLHPEAVRSCCPMAMMLTEDQVVEARKAHPSAEFVLYINSHAKVKTYADWICTSGNVLDVVKQTKSKTVLFGPDKNMAYYIQKRVPEKQIITVPSFGLCPTHHLITGQDVEAARKAYPNALLVVHPECRPEVQDAADAIASTEGIVGFCKKSAHKEFIIGTENGTLYRLGKEMPGKKFYPLSQKTYCPTMKSITLTKVRDSLINMRPAVSVPDEIREKALIPLKRMMALPKP